MRPTKRGRRFEERQRTLYSRRRIFPPHPTAHPCWGLPDTYVLTTLPVVPVYWDGYEDIDGTILVRPAGAWGK